MRAVTALFAGAAVLASLALGSLSATPVDPWAKLRRPRHVPRLEPGAPCPVTRARRVSRAFQLAQGAGPVYPVGGWPALRFTYPPVPEQVWYGSEWSGNKILWVRRPGHRGPVLIRGRQLDGPHGVRFDDGLDPVRELRLQHVVGTMRGRWQDRPSYTRLRAAGCYAWQVDGLTFSRVIVFRAVTE